MNNIKRRKLNISLLIITILLGGLVVRLSGLPNPDSIITENPESQTVDNGNDSTAKSIPTDALIAETFTSTGNDNAPSENSEQTSVSSKHETVSISGFEDVDPQTLISNHPFRKEALKILNSNLEETDSISRRKILSYCEHLRTSYTTKDIDFIRQVFSDNALIIVGNVVRTGKKSAEGYSSKVAYAVRSKEAYIKRLSEIFQNNRKINLDFSEFQIMRHPSIKGIYGVSLRQKYSTDNYKDDGYLFLLWDFRNPSMPQIHVRTWQPHKVVAQGEEVIDISDFNFE